MKTSCLRNKSRLVRYRMVECFTIDAKRLLFRYEQYCTILPSRNKLFSRNPFEFLHIRESLVSRSLRLDTRDSILETRSSNVSSIEARGSSLEVRVSSVNLLLSGTVHPPCNAPGWQFSELLPQPSPRKQVNMRTRIIVFSI